MTERLERPADEEQSANGPRRGPEPRTPRWVKAFIVVAGLAVVAFAVLHLTGGGMGSHTP
ncbi:MAG: hypothetical protein ABWY04_03060 [Arthrobacter sp.]